MKGKKLIGDILICSMIGFFFSQICNYLFTNGIYIDEYITNISEFNFILIISWVILGVIIGVMRD